MSNEVKRITGIASMGWWQRRWEKLTPSEKKFIFALGLLALALRVTYALSVDLIPENYLGIDLDAVEYDYLGWSIAQGRGVTDPAGEPNSLRFPGYLYFLGLIYFIFGHYHEAVLLIQALLGALVPLLIYFTARQIFEERTSRIAGILTACYPVYIYYVGWMMTENLFLFILSLLMYFTVNLGPKASWQKLALIGGLLGLLGLTRGVGLPFLGLIPVYIFFRLQGNFGMKLSRAAWVLGIGCLMLIPWTLRNYVTYQRWMLPSSEGGVVLWLGFNDTSLELLVDDPAYEYVNQVGRAHARSEDFYALLAQNNVFGASSIRVLFRVYLPNEPTPKNEVEGSQRLGNIAMGLLLKSPMVWVAKSIKQVFRFWHVLDERGRYVNGYGFILPFFLAGFWLLRRRIRDLIPLYIYPLVLYAVAIIFFADARFRMPFEGVLIIVGAFALERFLKLFRPITWGYICIAAFFLFNFYLRWHSLQVRMVIRSVAGALGFQLIEL